jgi:hypothetical protein
MAIKQAGLNKMNKINTLKFALTLALMLPSLQAAPVHANQANPTNSTAFDTFSVNTGSTKGINLNGQNQSNQTKNNQNSGESAPGVAATSTPMASWFEHFDQLRLKYCPTAAERVIMKRPLMQDEERVKKWTATACKISKSYGDLAKSLRSLAVPNGMSDAKDFRDLTADWYSDAAVIYDDLIRPRVPAKSIEELKRQLDEVGSRSQSLSSTIATLNAMDAELRKKYKVPGALSEDALQQFTNDQK